MSRAELKKILLIVFLAVASLLLAVVAIRLYQPNDYQDVPDITAREVFEHLKYLSSDELAGRLAGSPGAEKAAEYIAGEFESCGLKAITEKGDYFQRFSFVSGMRLGKANRLEIRQEEGPSSHKLLQSHSEFLPAAFSRNGRFQARAVFAGYGISAPDLGYDDYQGIDVKGQFVFVLRYGPDGQDSHGKFGKYHALRYKALTAREKGAIGIIYIDDSEDFSGSTLSKLRYDNSFADGGIAAIAISRPSARGILKMAGLDLDSLQERIGQEKKGISLVLEGLEVRLDCDLVKQTSSTANVVGYLEGNDSRSKNEIVIIGAHYDHLGMGENGSLSPRPGREIHNGADDNASGTAGLLELAEAFSRRRSDLKRSLVFIAFSGEEQGLLGSRHYVSHPIFPLEKTVAMINMDMIGRMKDKRLIIGGSGSSPVWKELLVRLNKETGFELKFQDDGFGPSDHSSFYGKDVAVLFFFTGVHQDYHRPSDDYQRIDTASQEKVLKLIYQTVLEVSDFDGRPLFTKVRESSRQEATGEFRVYLGTIPDYGEDVEGVKISGVREGSPAETAGLKGGDVIVECGGRKIKNIYDYTYVLQEFKVGQIVDIVVLRGEQRVTFKATLERRP